MTLNKDNHAFLLFVSEYNQCATYDGPSKQKITEWGVPQGSALSLLLIWMKTKGLVYEYTKLFEASLRWRHNDHAGVSNHQPHGCLLNRLFRRKSKKTSKLRVTGLCAGNSPGTGAFPAQMASYAESVSIWWRHHVFRTRDLMDIQKQSWVITLCLIIKVQPLSRWFRSIIVTLYTLLTVQDRHIRSPRVVQLQVVMCKNFEWEMARHQCKISV